MGAAILVLAFRHPQCLAAAIPIYKAAGFDIYVHVDLKANLSAYKLSVGPESERCCFITKRQSAFWAGFNLVRAELDLLDFALNANADYKQFILVSDDTFPWVSPNQLSAMFSDDISRIMLRKLTSNDVFYTRYREFFFLDHNAMSLLGRPIEMSFIDDLLLAKLEDISRFRRIGKKEIDIYYGSQWWSLSRLAADIVSWHYKNDDHLKASFEYSAAPDEMFVQTIVGNYVDINMIRGGSVYVDWSREPKPYVFSAVEEILNDLGPEIAFIRKVSSNNDIFLDLLKKRLS